MIILLYLFNILMVFVMLTIHNEIATYIIAFSAIGGWFSSITWALRDFLDKEPDFEKTRKQFDKKVQDLYDK